MKISILTPALTFIAVGSGIIVLMGYFIDLQPLQNLSLVFLNWAMILGAVALGVGVLNLARIHLQKLSSKSTERPYSIVLLVSMALTFLIVIIFGQTSPISLWIFDYVLVPIESSLVALLVILLIYALVRIFNRGVTVNNLVFALTTVFILSVTAILAWIDLPLIGELRDWIIQVWSLGAARAILIGIALGAVAAGLRILVGSDRPYEG